MAGDPFPLLSTGQARPGVLCPVLGFPVQEGLGRTRKSPVEGHQADGGTAALLWGKTERAGALQPAEEKAPGDLLCVCKYLNGGCGQDWARLFSVLGQEAMCTNWSTGGSLWTSGSNSVLCVCDWVLVQVVQRGCEVSFLEVFRNCLDVVLVTRVYVSTCLSMGLDQMTSRSPLQPWPILIQWDPA